MSKHEYDNEDGQRGIVCRWTSRRELELAIRSILLTVKNKEVDWCLLEPSPHADCESDRFGFVGVKWYENSVGNPEKKLILLLNKFFPSLLSVVKTARVQKETI